jgi:hypothetical protein
MHLDEAFEPQILPGEGSFNKKKVKCQGEGTGEGTGEGPGGDVEGLHQYLYTRSKAKEYSSHEAWLNNRIE